METTVLVDIKESDLINLFKIDGMKLGSMCLEANGDFEEVFKQFPFTLYQNRMMGTHIVTINISLVRFLFFKGLGLVK